MKLVFEQTPEHLQDFAKNCAPLKKWRLYILIGAGLLLLNLGFSFQKGNLTYVAIISWLIPIVIIIAIWVVLIKYLKYRQFNAKNEPLITGHREVELLEEGIRFKTDVSDATFQWNGITKLEESAMSYFLYLGKRRALIIPKSAFKTMEQINYFEDLLRQKLKV